MPKVFFQLLFNNFIPTTLKSHNSYLQPANALKLCKMLDGHDRRG